jgi:hypothetical protein
MKFKDFSFGAVQIDNTVYDHTVVIDRGKIHMRKKKASKQFKDEFGHTPLSAKANRRLAQAAGWPEVGFEEIATDLLRAHLWIATSRR